jgi:hypothetical protein
MEQYLVLEYDDREMLDANLFSNLYAAQDYIAGLMNDEHDLNDKEWIHEIRKGSKKNVRMQESWTHRLFKTRYVLQHLYPYDVF